MIRTRDVLTPTTPPAGPTPAAKLAVIAAARDGLTSQVTGRSAEAAQTPRPERGDPARSLTTRSSTTRGKNAGVESAVRRVGPHDRRPTRRTACDPSQEGTAVINPDASARRHHQRTGGVL